MKISIITFLSLFILVSQAGKCQKNIIYFKNTSDSAECLSFIKALVGQPYVNHENHPQLVNELQSFTILRNLFDSTLTSKYIGSTIWITTIINETGDVKCIQFNSFLEPTLNNKIIDIIKDWKFLPATQNSKAIDMEYIFPLKIKTRKK